MTLTGARPPTFLAMCFGLCLPESYTAVPTKEPPSEPDIKPVKPTRPVTSWREIPVIAKYELLKRIGKGGFSEIWLAEARGTKQLVAVKVVQLFNEDLEPSEVAMLLSEAKYLRTLDCPYLLHCHESVATEEWLVLVLEYLSGGEMLDHIHKVMKYTEAEAGKLFAQVVSAVSYMHNLNLMHRDIKPENIMFAAPVEECEAEGRALRVKVIDLGMAALYDPDKVIRGCIGTPGFVAPELWNDKPHTPACDIYALGVVLFVMLTGRKPHSGIDIRMMTYCNKSIKDAPGLRDERFLSLSPAARALLLAMLADDPRDRPSAAEVLRHAFITAVEGSAEAHREMGEVVRRRMRELAQLRRVHGLRFALHVSKPQDADHQAFLEAVEQRRLKLKGAAGGFRWNSQPPGGSLTFARSSLATSYATPPAVVGAPERGTDVPYGPGTAQAPGAAGCVGGAAAAGSATAATAGGATAAVMAAGPRHGATAAARASSPFACASGEPPGSEAPQHAGSSRPTSVSASLSEGRPAGASAAVAGVSNAHAAWPPDPRTDTDGSPPDVASRGLPVPVPTGLAARPQSQPPSAPGKGRLSPLVEDSHHQQQAHDIDPMALLNALPALYHCPSMPELDLSLRGGGGAGVGPNGERASPLVSAGVVEEALLSKAMSTNPYTLELLEHQDTISRVLDRGR